MKTFFKPLYKAAAVALVAAPGAMAQDYQVTKDSLVNLPDGSAVTLKNSLLSATHPLINVKKMDAYDYRMLYANKQDSIWVDAQDPGTHVLDQSTITRFVTKEGRKVTTIERKNGETLNVMFTGTQEFLPGKSDMSLLKPVEVFQNKHQQFFGLKKN